MVAGRENQCNHIMHAFTGKDQNRTDHDVDQRDHLDANLPVMAVVHDLKIGAGPTQGTIPYVEVLQLPPPVS